jgi:hypothetical protein
VFASVCVCSSQDARITWTNELRKAKPQKKTLRRSKKSTRRKKMCCHRRTVRSRAPDCPVPHAGLSGAPGTTVWCHTSDCPVHQELQPQRLVPGGTRREDHWTVRCDVRTVRCEKVCAPTVTCSDRLTARRTGQGHRTVRCNTESSSFPRTTIFVLGAIITPQPAISVSRGTLTLIKRMTL